jgi:hypothetical protein
MVQSQQLGVGSVCDFSGAFLMQVATTTPQTPGRLLTVGPDMAEVLAAVALCKASMILP